MENFRRPLPGVLPPSTCCQFRIPDSWQNEDVLEGGAYFIIPAPLLNLIIREVGRDLFAPEDLKREHEIAAAAGTDYDNVAIRNGGFVTYLDLGVWKPVSLDTTAAAEILGKNFEQTRQLSRLMTERLEAIDGVRRGYLGWLLTQRAFLDEHDDLVVRHRTQIRAHGFPQPILGQGTIENGLQSEADWVQVCREFCGRWRLQSMALPYLPRPHALEIPSLFAQQETVDSGGIVFASIPDIYPTRGRGLLDETIEDALHGRIGPDHLSDWFQLVSKTSASKNVIPAYDRWFRLQHYWRLLHRRYPQSIHRKKEPLIQAFACFLHVSIDTIKSDLRRISSQLDSGWEKRYVQL
ncbi:MAG: hypothetical protein JWN70_2231 [Planctomycetaceae bacterium]|nr:hypothetical protein [Planctomycetaceae bacterium]